MRVVLLLFVEVLAAAPLQGAPPFRCVADEDCELNGDCSRAGKCRCGPGWAGEACSVLVLLPADKAAGLRIVDPATGEQTTTWGGGAVYDAETARWHLFASEIANSCGLNAWFPNSRVIRASSPAPDGPYTRRETILPAFAHNPQITRAHDGTLLTKQASL